jgi:hypothetical protein
MYVNLQKVGFRFDEHDPFTQSGLNMFNSISGNLVSQISQLHTQENKRDYGDVAKKQI